ncbi:hypothetical protein OIU74_016616 [Salix koriyanagi]|uniref:Uncharacterized protein n=1 Tax=Salix koriyanagi TaxID=2511006 RepID=A0A9Q0SS09_9ROSI|nr:hypothetical protein OIU74_016616 [Salix koriyanagi]
MNQLKLELEDENEEASHLSRNVEILMDDLQKAARADEFIRREPSNMSITSENTYEIQILKKELGIAIVKNGELRARSEQSATRAEAAEKAKTISKINKRGVKNKRRG